MARRDNDFVVPAGLLIAELNWSRRLHLEQQRLREHFPQFGFAQAPDGSLRINGTLRTNEQGTCPLSIVLPQYHPHEIPSVYPVGWDSACPHIYQAGNLCIMRLDRLRRGQVGPVAQQVRGLPAGTRK
ncbi:hypothetical protein [Herbidospora mongoliensis]|uniref:hypothetical protein n=1 Tax=Herbidospora mongoliensis TaxID=688067 RepID=UPI00083468A0|nr:hypothetical protein [Herbidospora mongoliensis]